MRYWPVLDAGCNEIAAGIALKCVERNEFVVVLAVQLLSLVHKP
jgi:hypothetical protein